MKVKVAIPCWFLTEVEIPDKEIPNELKDALKNDFVEDLDKLIGSKKLDRIINKRIEYINKLKNFEVNEDSRIVFWSDDD